MKLLFVHDRIGPMAGAESNLFQTALALRERGHETGLVHGLGTGRDTSSWEEVFVRRFPLVNTGGETMEDALALFQPDVVYVHNSPGVEVTSVLSRTAMPVVRMIHDHQMFCLRGCRYSSWTRRPCTRALSAHCVFPCGGCISRREGGGWTISLASYRAKKQELEFHRQFARLIVASEYMREELRRNGFADSQIEIHAPVPSQIMGEVTADFGSNNRLVYAGQIARGKGVDVLLESLARVRAPFECVILGDGHHRPYCEALSRRLGLDDRVRFLGYVPATELARHYREASLAVVSSVWPEPFGLAGLEAMRHGLPVVAFDVGGIRAWLEDGVTGLLAPWMDRVAYAERIDRLLQDKPLARRLGGQAREAAAGRFDFSRYVTGLENLFNRLSSPACEVAV